MVGTTFDEVADGGQITNIANGDGELFAVGQWIELNAKRCNQVVLAPLKREKSINELTNCVG